MTWEVKRIKRLPGSKPLTNLPKAALKKVSEKTTKIHKTVAVNSDPNKGKKTKANEEQSVNPSSTSTSTNAPEKTILTVVNTRNQQADFAKQGVTNKAESNPL